MILRIGKGNQLRNKEFTPPFWTVIPSGSTKRAGFTFIELVLVTIIILILVGISSPLFRRPFSNFQLKNTCQNLVQLMRRVQTKAIAERRIFRINFDFEKSLFWPSVQVEDPAGEFVEIKERWGKTFSTPDGISINSVEDDLTFITFYPNGRADQAEIKIQNTKGNTFTISTQKNIGYVKVTEE